MIKPWYVTGALDYEKLSGLEIIIWHTIISFQETEKEKEWKFSLILQ